MLAVLTEQNANIPALLKSAATNVNTILANSRGIRGNPGPFGRLIINLNHQPSAGRAAISAGRPGPGPSATGTDRRSEWRML